MNAKELWKQAEALRGTAQEVDAFVAARKRLKLTQEKLARLSGVARATIAGLETHRQKPAEKLMGRLWKALAKAPQPKRQPLNLQWAAELLHPVIAAQNARIGALEEQVRTLRELYDAGTEMALAHERFEQLNAAAEGDKK